MSRTTLTAALGALAIAGTCLTAASSTAAPGASSAAPSQTTLAGHLLSPLSIDVADDGTRYFSQNFAGRLMKQSPGKAAVPVYTLEQEAELGAVSERDGSVRFAVTGQSQKLLGLRPSGAVYGIADLGKYEESKNPDAGKTYGFTSLADECAESFPEDGQPPVYQGIVESHPYGTALASSGTTYVADAAANSILAVSTKGVVRTVAVLPSALIKVNASFAEQADMPECAIGEPYRVEPVPTDVEVGPDGKLYVTTLPGGPEDGSAGKVASVYKIDPASGATTKVVAGLVSATGLAVSHTGDLYIAELFGERIVRVPKGTSTKQTYVSVGFPADVAWSKSLGLFATVNAVSGFITPGEPDGRVVRYYN